MNMENRESNQTRASAGVTSRRNTVLSVEFISVLRWCAVVIALLVSGSLRANADELLFENSDFEKGTLANWTAEGDAFGNQPTKGDNPAARDREPSKHQGDFWIGTYENYSGKEGKPGATRGDGPTGTLTSTEFPLRHRYITFRIGAGHLPGAVGVKLIGDGQEVLLATGFDSETMFRISFDAAAFKGKSARLVVFDNAKDGWGHINVDDFMGTDAPTSDPLPEVAKATPPGSQEFRLTPGFSASAYPGVGYDQPLRPQFHFTSRKNWFNDPNGMVFDGEKYHLFFQHNPKGPAWGNMTWGHAVSTDMLHWQQLDHALLPYEVDGRKGTIFSGTAVVDHNNSLGVQVGSRKTLVAFFTYANNQPFYQAMAYSTDGGATWTYYNEGRAVVPNQGLDKGERDPKVFWHEPSQQWVMALWVQRKPGKVRFFTSTNLKDWTMASDLDRDWAYECMDVFFAPVDGDPKNIKCVIYDASFDYEIGTFDGRTFTTETGPRHIGRGNFYAAQSFNNMPGDRTVQIGWMNGGPNSAETYGVPFNQQMSFPCDLTVRATAEGLRLNVWPIKEIDALARDTKMVENVKLSEGVNALAGFPKLDLIDLTVEFEPGTAKQIVFDLPGTTVRYDSTKKEFIHLGVQNDGQSKEMTTLDNVQTRAGRISVRFLVDRLSLEAYAFGGERFSAHYFNPNHAPARQSIRAIGGEAKIVKLTVRQLNSAWNRNGTLN